ncbi:MAG: tRNA (cytidine(34)-2'-O)-methyltransferase [Candidatus Riflebacteria bacterium]|nr:tRNA (cytidine(34)-2'-O)-methyltransferase [Candidatus Riflebacteria bacterium]
MSDQKHSLHRLSEPRFYIVLIWPDIPQNTGNIARLAYATGCSLVLVRPFGFRLTDKSLERAGMDYWKKLSPIILDDLDDFFSWISNKKCYFFSAHSNNLYTEVNFKLGDVMVFGSESSGLPPEVIEYAKNSNLDLTLPMIKEARCINLSSAAAVAVYEGVRQLSLSF